MRLFFLLDSEGLDEMELLAMQLLILRDLMSAAVRPLVKSNSL